METKKKARKPARAQLTKIINGVKHEMVRESPDKVTVQVKKIY
jgi:hypothetical protein